MDRATAFLYEHAPREGITAGVHWQSWDAIFGLSVEGERLIVTRKCSLDYPWDAYSFSIAEGWLVDKLWPPKPPVPAASAAPSTSEFMPTHAPEAPAPEIAPAAVPKMRQSDYVRGFLKDLVADARRKDKFVLEYDEIGKGCTAINEIMKGDSKADAYKDPRAIERYLREAKLYPLRKSGK
jgi:hypothetical protein